MAQHHAWEKEYQTPKLVTLSHEPHNDVRNFWKFLKKEYTVPAKQLNVLDLGSGTGKHAFYFAERGAKVVGMEIAKNALAIARERTITKNVSVQFVHADIGKTYPFEKNSFDIVLDILASNSLNEDERSVYLRETYRVLKSGGWFMVKILC